MSESTDQQAGFRTVCKLADLVEGLGRTVYVDDAPIALFLIEGQVHAIDDTCPHMGASLGSGFVESGVVTCPWHFWRFRICDGAWADNPRLGISCHAARIVGDEVQVAVAPRPETKR
jgi:nitrite reductase (NADH) small subunit/3-phenylpropionate/trans-cinnamate dioxygenase ferredoxin subunit